ncbi:MAG TPA: hypothetical protein VF695_00775 [Sphingomonas sp.]|jgi:hypothetical protein
MILIYMNTMEWGGVDQFVTGFAHYLRAAGREFAILDRQGSRLRSDLPWAAFVTSDNVATLKGRVTQIFLPSISKVIDPELPWSVAADATVFTWVVQKNDALYQYFPHSQRIVRRFGFAAVPWLFRLLSSYRKRIDALFQVMLDRRAMAFMDSVTVSAFRFFYPAVRFEPAYIPIPAAVGDSIDARAPDDGPFTFGYLGRVDAFKFSALGPFVAHQLSAIAKARPVRLLAITAGTHEAALRQVCAGAGVELDLRGFMPNTEARMVMRQEAHLGVAMGTAALDMAATGLPCVFLDPAEKPGWPAQTSYRFVHESSDYMLGEWRDFPAYAGGVRSLSETIDMVKRDAGVGERGREHVRRVHSPDRVHAMLLSAIEGSAVTMRELEPIAKTVTNANARDLAFFARMRRVVER